MGDKINLRCETCGNAMRVTRRHYEPPEAVEVETDECNICEAAAGGFAGERYYDRNGRLVAIHP